jgi:hypothetical protein
MASSTICFQPNSSSAPPIPSGSANAAISAATTPARATTTPICVLDMRQGDYLAKGRGGTELESRCSENRRLAQREKTP